jgi:hypothetical protein
MASSPPPTDLERFAAAVENLKREIVRLALVDLNRLLGWINRRLDRG